MGLRFSLNDFTVEGHGPFLFDMLRHDECWPVGPEDAGKIEAASRAGEGGRFSIRLRGLQEPTVGRWESFTWRVVAKA